MADPIGTMTDAIVQSYEHAAAELVATVGPLNALVLTLLAGITFGYFAAVAPSPNEAYRFAKHGRTRLKDALQTTDTTNVFPADKKRTTTDVYHPETDTTASHPDDLKALPPADDE